MSQGNLYSRKHQWNSRKNEWRKSHFRRLFLEVTKMIAFGAFWKKKTWTWCVQTKDSISGFVYFLGIWPSITYYARLIAWIYSKLIGLPEPAALDSGYNANQNIYANRLRS